MNDLVTIVVVPRERFSETKRCLASIYAHTPPGIPLVYVDGGSPNYVKAYLEEEATRRGFRLIRENRFLSPNEARNIGFSQVATKYVVFIDNDALVAAGWLDALVRCAEETGAAIAAPLYLIGEPTDQCIHMFGGRINITGMGSERHFWGYHIRANRHLPTVRHKLKRGPCDYGEFHCLLVRSDILKAVGPLDEELTTMAEHLDLALAVTRAGGTIYREPDSVVTYLAFSEFLVSDVSYFRFRWEEGRTLRTVDHFHEKWHFKKSGSYANMLEWTRVHRKLIDFAGPNSAPRHERLDIMSHPYAQTILQLYNQVQALGYRDEDLRKLRTAYEFATKVLGTCFRGTGKPFVSHLAGTASVLAAHGAPFSMVVAGLLPATYTHGVIAGERITPTPSVRAYLSDTFGEHVSKLVEAYVSVEAFGSSVANQDLDIDTLALTTAKVLLIRIANDIDEFLDLGNRYCSKECLSIHLRAPALATMAAKLGFESLVSELAEADRQAQSLTASSVLRSEKDGSYYIEPVTLRPPSRVRRLARSVVRVARSLRRFVRSHGFS
jgi:GT2 family glycosyltransferase